MRWNGNYWECDQPDFAAPICGRKMLNNDCLVRGCLKKMALAYWDEDEGQVRYECDECLIAFSYLREASGRWRGEWRTMYYVQ